MKNSSENKVNSITNEHKYEVAVRFAGSDGWEKICECNSRQQAEEEIEYQRTIEDDGDCEYTIIDGPAEKPNNVPRVVVVNQFGAIISTED